MKRFCLTLCAIALLCLAPAVPACGIGTSPSYAQSADDDPIRAAGGVIVQQPKAMAVGTSPSVAPVDPWAAYSAGNYALGVTLTLILALAALRKVAPQLFSSDLAGAATAFAGSFLGALATALNATDVPLSLRLITPPGGTILDPFSGSGTTLLAADTGGWNAVGIEQHEPYVEIARGRMESAQ